MTQPKLFPYCHKRTRQTPSARTDELRCNSDRKNSQHMLHFSLSKHNMFTISSIQKPYAIKPSYPISIIIPWMLLHLLTFPTHLEQLPVAVDLLHIYRKPICPGHMTQSTVKPWSFCGIWPGSLPALHSFSAQQIVQTWCCTS